MYNPFAGLPISCDWVCHRARGSAGGIDFAVGVGYPVRASFDGLLRNVTNAVGGNIAILERSDGLMFMHDHLSQFVHPGHYTQGQVIGYSGGKRGAPGAGNSTGPHLHVNAYSNGEVKNPYDYWGNSVASNKTNIITNQEEEEVSIRGITWTGSDGKLYAAQYSETGFYSPIQGTQEDLNAINASGIPMFATTESVAQRIASDCALVREGKA